VSNMRKFCLICAFAGFSLFCPDAFAQRVGEDTFPSNGQVDGDRKERATQSTLSGRANQNTPGQRRTIVDYGSMDVHTQGPNRVAHRVGWKYVRGTGQYLGEDPQNPQRSFRAELGTRDGQGKVTVPGMPVTDDTKGNDPIIWVTGTYDRQGPYQAYLQPTSFRTRSGIVIPFSGRFPLRTQN